MKFFKKLLAVITAAAMTIGALTSVAGAESITNTAKTAVSGKEETATISALQNADYKLVLSSNGDIKLDFSFEFSTIFVYLYDINGNNVQATEIDIVSGKYNIWKERARIDWNSAVEKSVGTIYYKDLLKGTYYLRITRTNGYGTGKCIFTMTFPSASPTPLKLSRPVVNVASYTEDTVELEWNALNGAQKYQIYYKLQGDKRYKKYATTKKTSYTVENLESNSNGVTYNFIVRAIAKSNGKTIKSKYSSVVSVTLIDDCDDWEDEEDWANDEKPVIYLYPEEKTDVSVSLDFMFGGKMTCSYPDYNNGWNVTAMPDGTLYDNDGKEYYCLYWEGLSCDSLDCSKGWCVAGNDTASFLREKLLYIGLSEREANEFIIYWLPLMQDNPYNIISLHTEEYCAAVPLCVSPAPDSVIRVFMTFEVCDEAIEVEPQTLPHYERNGFTLVEWGGRRFK